MFGFKKKKQKPLWIMAKDVMDLIQSDYETDMSFTLIEFHYQGGAYLMGSCIIPPDAEERKENISFVFQDQAYQTFEEFQENACIGGIKIYELEEPVEIGTGRESLAMTQCLRLHGGDDQTGQKGI